MKRGILRIISLILILSMLPVVPVWAQETQPDQGQPTEQTQPAETLPEASVPTETTPVKTEPEESVPTETLPVETEPEESVPAESVPVETEPEESVPEETVPEETQPEVLPMMPYITSDGHYMAQPELLQNFTFPAGWVKPALEFCVANGILSGRDEGLAHEAPITRAETAAILVRLLGAAPDYDALKDYHDVNAAAWYYDEVSAAVSVGLMKGTSDVTIEPNAKITREDACVLLSRAFGVYAGDHEAYLRFKDSASVSDYARAAVSGMADQGYLKGYEDGTVCPKTSITRGEFAKLIYELVTQVASRPSEMKSPGRIVYNGYEPIPEDFKLVGNLILGCNYPTDSTMEKAWISNRLVLRMAPGASIHLEQCSTRRVVVASDVHLSGDDDFYELYVGAEGATVDQDATTAFLYSGCTLNGQVERLHCSEAGICVTMNGNTNHARLHKSYITLRGNGYAGAVDIYGRQCRVELNNGGCTDHIYIYDFNNALSTVNTVSSWYNYQRREPYTTATMEGFVNQKGYSSDTEYLIWVSTTTTTVNVFKGEKGSWKLEKSMACALGAPWSPTVRGTFKTFLRDNEWDFGPYKCRWVTYFYNGYAFHSRKWSPDYSYLVDPSINCLVSAGCVRMYDEDCYFIYENIPIRTTVVVY